MYMWHYDDALNIILGVGTKFDNPPLFLNSTMLMLLGVISILLLTVLFFFYFYLSRIFRKINTKISGVNDIIHNDFSDRIVVESQDEIGDISRSFNILLDKINALIKDVVQKETAQRDANLKALQYQINPHFIYNTIEIFFLPRWNLLVNTKPEMHWLLLVKCFVITLRVRPLLPILMVN